MPAPVWQPPKVKVRHGVPADRYAKRPNPVEKAEAHPAGDFRARHLIRWYNAGADGRIPWGSPGDFDACVAVASEHMDPSKAKGFCAERHHDALGIWPATHAAHERAHVGKDALDESDDLDEIVNVIKVGPKGYIHGWIFVGAPGAGDSIFHPAHGHGKVSHVDQHGHVHVAFDSGKRSSFAATKTGSGQLARRSKDVNDEFGKHLKAAAAANRRGDHAAASQHYRDAAAATTHPKIRQEMLDRAARDAKKTGATAPIGHPVLDRLLAAGTPQEKSEALDAASLTRMTDDQKKVFEAARKAIENDPNNPDWLRARAWGHDDKASAVMQQSSTRDAVGIAATGPGPSGKYFTTRHDAGWLLAPDSGELNQLPPRVRQAIIDRRNEAVGQLLKDPNAAPNVINAIFPGARPDTDRFRTLDTATQSAVHRDLEARVLQLAAVMSPQRREEASKLQGVLDRVDAVRLNAAQKLAADLGVGSYASKDDILDAAKSLSNRDFDELGEGHKVKLLGMLDGVGNSNYGGSRDDQVRARDLKDYFTGTGSTQGPGDVRDAVLAATRDNDIIDDGSRALAYHGLSPTQFDALTPAEKTAIRHDVDQLAGANSSLPNDLRYDLQEKADQLDTKARPPEVTGAVTAASPHSPADDASTVQAFGDLTKAQYAALPPSYKQAVDDRLDALAATEPGPYALLKAKFDPTWKPPHAPVAPVTTTADPKVRAALDVVYGVHPKSRTAAHQLSTYGDLRTADFNQMSTAEQSTLLGDLSFIATTSKGPNKTRAERLINNFTPAGTPYGKAPVQAIIPPVNSVAGQNRYPDPAGVSGLMREATDKGANGDGWSVNPNGTRGPWGQYGAAGAMLAHDDNNGTRRYLMVQRGPAISDPGKWQFPGGAIDSKETPHQGATREIVEELGFTKGALDGAMVHGEHVYSIPGGWKYTSIAATVPTMLTPDLSTHHARAETSDAKWLTEAEIADLDRSGKMLKPLAGGQLQKNVMSLFPPAAATRAVRPGPRTSRPDRLVLPTPTVHKPSKGRDLLSDKTAINALRQQVKQDRVKYDGKVADGRLAAIGAAQGFDDTPTVVKKKEIDRLLASGDYIEVWRGVRGNYGGKSAADINEEFRSGPAWYGKGIFGNGYYFATDKSVVTGGRYNDGTKNSTLRALIPKSAIIAQHADVHRDSAAIAAPYSKAKGKGYESATLYDEGRYAAAKGIDGIEIPSHSQARGGGRARHVATSGKPAYNWLNRSVMIVQEAN
jgi:8-oxo-dGTP pyrophosphatase MutT (NUDIX family)